MGEVEYLRANEWLAMSIRGKYIDKDNIQQMP